MSHTVFGEVKHAFKVAIDNAFPALSTIQPIVSVAKPVFGDYQCNSGPMLFKTLKTSSDNVFKSPKDVANKLTEYLPKDMFSEVTVAPAGFITVRVSPVTLKKFLTLEYNGDLKNIVERPLKCLVDFSSPNIAKEMHVGHLRSTILGESIARVLESVGHTVQRINHLGDWGTQFGMLIEFMKEKYPNFQENPPHLQDLTTFYREAKVRFDQDPIFKKRAQLAVPLLQGGDPAARAAWKLFCDISSKEFEKVYERLGIQLVPRGESFYNDMLPSVVKEIEDKGLMTVSDGAKCFFTDSLENDSVPLIVVKSDGGMGYDSTDLACIKHRLVLEKNDLVLYVTDIGQENHFTKLFKAAKLMNWYDPNQARCVHIGFGLVQGEDGKKFKTRSGDVVKLVDLLDEAVDRCLKEIETRAAAHSGATNKSCDNAATPEKNDCSNEDVQEADDDDDDDAFQLDVTPQEAAKALGFSAIRYFDLKQHRITNYKFSYDKMLDPKRNTAVYLIYAYARICAIFRKAGVKAETLDIQQLTLEETQERELALQLVKFYDVIDLVLEDFHIHRIAEYVYDLSRVFTTFYQHCKVVGSDQQQSRLLLCELTRRLFEKAFYFLGITPLKRI